MGATTLPPRWGLANKMGALTYGIEGKTWFAYSYGFISGLSGTLHKM